MDLRRLGTRFRYFINNLLIRNPFWQILFLFAVSAVVVAVGMLLVKDITQDSLWWSFTRLLDQGTFIYDNYDLHIALPGVLVTICGILILSLLIGILSSKITEQLDSLKRGRSPVIEKNHLIVCGNGDRLYEVARELAEARMQDSAAGSIVMFSSSTREEMEELLVQRMGKKLARRVICRSGELTDVDSLKLPGFADCAGFVIIGDDDSAILKTLVAVNSISGDNRPVGVCELQNRAGGRIAEMAYPGVHWIPVREIVMRLLVQICRQPGLSAVYGELLSFTGNEFYLNEHPEVTGLCFDELFARVSGGVVAGIQKNGKVILNPHPAVVVDPGDLLLVLAENGGSYSFNNKPFVEEVSISAEKVLCGEPLQMLVFSGYSRKFSFLLKLLDTYALTGAVVTVAGSVPEADGSAMLKEIQFRNCTASYTRTDRTDPESVEKLHPELYDSIIVVSGKSPGMSDEDADSECIVTLLVLREIAGNFKESWNATVVSEIRNPRNRRLATAAGIDDFVISNEVCSMVMAQLVKQPDLGQVYEEIFDPSGCEVQLRCPSLYMSRTFAKLTAEGLQRREVILGWLTGRGSESVVRLNPGREEELPEGSGSRVIVIAER